MIHSGNFKKVTIDDHVGGFQSRGRQGLVCLAKGPEGNGEPQKDLKEQRRGQFCIFKKKQWLQGVRYTGESDGLVRGTMRSEKG